MQKFADLLEFWLMMTVAGAIILGSFVIWLRAKLNDFAEVEAAKTDDPVKAEVQAAELFKRTVLGDTIAGNIFVSVFTLTSCFAWFAIVSAIYKFL